MAQSFRLADKVDGSPAHGTLAPSDDRQPGAQSLISDEFVARRTQVNLLIMGADDTVTRFVTSLWPSFVTPRVVRRRGQRLRLPMSRPAGTILVYDVHTLTRREQDALYRWMDRGDNRTRVVSTTPMSLLPLMETGAFNEDLYYRLNVLMLDLTSPVAQ